MIQHLIEKIKEATYYGVNRAIAFRVINEVEASDMTLAYQTDWQTVGVFTGPFYESIRDSN